MTTSIATADARVRAVRIDDERLTVDLVDGRTIAVPLAWFPRHARAARALGDRRRRPRPPLARTRRGPRRRGTAAGRDGDGALMLVIDSSAFDRRPARSTS